MTANYPFSYAETDFCSMVFLSGPFVSVYVHVTPFWVPCFLFVVHAWLKYTGILGRRYTRKSETALAMSETYSYQRSAPEP